MSGWLLLAVFTYDHSLFFMIQHPSHFLRLSDNRLLEYAEYGDPQGAPVLYFHGFLGSCHQAALADGVGKRLKLRIIAPNRPGIGASTPCVRAAMTDYAQDIEQLLNALEITSAACIGLSAGGCFALACAYALPHRLSLVGAAGCIGPLNILRNLQTMHWVRRSFLSGCLHHPHVVSGFLRVIFLVCRYRPQWLYTWLVQSSCLLQPGNRAMIAELLWRDYQAVFLQEHGVQGLLQEARLFFSWGFDLRDFPTQTRVLFWHGKKDTITPWSVARDIARAIPQTEVVLCPGGHLTFLTRIEEILERVQQALSRDSVVLRPARSLSVNFASFSLPHLA